MGLKDLVDESEQVSDVESRYRSFSYHPYEEKIEEWVDELQQRFPEEVQVDFVEVSTRMTKTQAKAYFRDEGQYLRVSERFVDTEDDEYLKQIVLHEMVHLYFNQIGKPEVSDNNALFNWVLGAVNADMSGTSPGHWKYEIMEDFME